MNLSDFNNIDPKDLASAPMPVRAVVLVLILVAIVAAGWFLVWSDASKSLEKERKEEESLRKEYTTKKGEAIHFEAYKRRLAEIEQSLEALLRQLPDRSQMDALLTDINQAGVGRGLEFDLFRPGGESLSEYYATLPVSIKVVGSYHDMGGFLTDLARLPRIVTIHDMGLTPGKDGKLNMDARIQTYRYLDETEQMAAKKAKQEATKKAAAAKKGAKK
ncbi:MAG: type 4a pilus biogenesis protein PilO [Pseudomonadota bacterium]